MTGAPLSPRNARVTAARLLLRSKGRAEAERFLVDGPQAIAEALAYAQIHELFVTAAALDRHGELVAQVQKMGAEVALVDDGLAAELSGTVTPQGLIAVCDLVDVPLGVGLTTGPTLVAMLAQVRDPGNAGTVVRCADAAGADAVIFSTGSVDVHNPKAVRASAGSLFHLSISVDVAIDEAFSALRGRGLRIVAADGTADSDLEDEAKAGQLDIPTAWVFGNEAWGLPEEIRAACDAVVRVPIYGRAESLNLATAAAVCLYASARAQRT